MSGLLNHPRFFRLLYQSSLIKETDAHVSIKALIALPPTIAPQVSSSSWVSRENTLSVLLLEQRLFAYPNMGTDSNCSLLLLSQGVLNRILQRRGIRG